MPPRFVAPEQPFRLPFGIEPVQFVAVAYALWLAALSILFLQESGNKIFLELVLLSGSIPALLHALFLPVDTRGNAPGLWFMWAFLVIFLASYLVNDFTWEDLVNVFNVLFIFLIGIMVASTLDTSLIPRIAGAYALIMAPYLLYINLTGERVWGRLSAGTQPNVWGLYALTVAIGAFALNRRILQFGCLAVTFLTMYNAQTRGSMFALLPVLFIFVYHWYAYEKKIDFTWKMLATYVGIVAAFCVVAFYADVIINDILHLNDPHRGLGTGATGRDEAWGEALRLWYGSPFLGVGFRKHEALMVFTDLSAHNAYLAMLADTGFIGFLTYMAFLTASIICAFRSVSDNKLRLFFIAAILAYSFTGMFERRAINVGNSFSITFIFCCLFVLRQGWLNRGVQRSAAPVTAPTVRT